jgi:L-rhamnose isomerase
MSLIGFRCPNTGREVTTGIDTEREQLARMRKLRISVSCPDCPDGHGIPADEMFLVGGMTPTPHLPDPRRMVVS